MLNKKGENNAFSCTVLSLTAQIVKVLWSPVLAVFFLWKTAVGVISVQQLVYIVGIMDGIYCWKVNRGYTLNKWKRNLNKDEKNHKMRLFITIHVIEQQNKTFENHQGSWRSRWVLYSQFPAQILTKACCPRLPAHKSHRLSGFPLSSAEALRNIS